MYIKGVGNGYLVKGEKKNKCKNIFKVYEKKKSLSSLLFPIWNQN